MDAQDVLMCPTFLLILLGHTKLPSLDILIAVSVMLEERGERSSHQSLRHCASSATKMIRFNLWAIAPEAAIKTFLSEALFDIEREQKDPHQR